MLADRPNATTRLYPALNHLFMEGSGTPSPAEYERPTHVHPRVIEDVATWVLTVPPRQ